MTDAIVAHSHDMIRKGSKSFAAAASLFDPQTRSRAYMLYAWCRHCDDQIDGQDHGFGNVGISAPERLARLETLRDKTRDAFRGEPTQDPIFAAFQRVAREAAIPQRHAMELLAGFEMDVRGDRYPELADTLIYCYRVAGVVGVMMASVMGVREHAALARAADLGIAFQLTNIARDVMDDARAGRCYLPESWLREAGVPPDGLADGKWRPALVAVVMRLLDEAERYYASAMRGLPSLSFRSAWAVATALGVYREIGDIVRARAGAAWDERAVVGRSRKAWLGVRGLGQALVAVTLGRRSAMPARESALWMMEE
jgi:phytoene synthase